MQIRSTVAIALAAFYIGAQAAGLGGMSSIKGTPIVEDVVRDVLVRVASFTSKTVVSAKGMSLSQSHPIRWGEKQPV